jgi:putative membrane protein
MIPALAAVAPYAHYGYFPFFFLIPLLWITLLVLLFVFLGRRARRNWGNWGAPHGRGAEATLAERFANGDIDEVEYRTRLEVLRANREQRR